MITISKYTVYIQHRNKDISRDMGSAAGENSREGQDTVEERPLVLKSHSH